MLHVLRIPILAALLAAGSSAQLIKLSEADEIEIGRSAAATIDQNQPLLDSKDLAAWLERTGKAITGVSSRRGKP